MAPRNNIPGALVTALRDARHVCVLTGAGVSAESGVPTFRDAQEGLWAKYRPEDLAGVAAPELVPGEPSDQEHGGGEIAQHDALFITHRQGRRRQPLVLYGG